MGELVAAITQPNLMNIVGGFLLYMYNNEIKKTTVDFYLYLKGFMTNKLTIKLEGGEKTTYAIKETINEQLDNKLNHFIVVDGGLQPNYKIENGSYHLTYNKKTIYVTISNDSVELETFFGDIQVLKSFVNDAYKKHGRTDSVLVFYILDNQSWNYPIYRRPRNIIKITQTMSKFTDSVKQFLSSGPDYDKEGRAFRRGYLIKGAPGTGKSTVVEKVAIDYNMSIYMVNLNSERMTDAVLIRLVSGVPPMSLVVFDEMDRQYEAIKNNPDIHLSTGGILNAIDGAQRLNRGNIAVIIVNDLDKLDDDLKTPLLRKGRIDEVFTFTEIL